MAKTKSFEMKSERLLKIYMYKVFQYDFNVAFRSQMKVKRCNFAEKRIKMIIHNFLLQNFQIRHWSYFGGSVVAKSVGKHAPCEERANAEKYVETLQDNFFQGTITIRGKKLSHSSSKMSMQPLTNQYLSKFT